MSNHTRRRARHGKGEKRSAVFMGVVGTLAGLVAVGVLAAVLLCASWLKDLPDYTNLDLYAKSGYSTIYASDRKTELAKITLENRVEVARNEVSDYVVDGTVATEDERFYNHAGVDLMGIARALVNNLRGGSREGASTITQQLVRNTVLLDEMNSITVERKVREMYIALKVEQEYSKDQLLMMYLNVINYGDGNYGIETASNDYFDCHASELTLSQAAMLVGIPQSPTANNPRNDYDKALSRSHLVLERMLKNGKIAQAEYDEAVANPPVLAKKKDLSDDPNSKLAPYFVDYVKQLLQSDEFNISELSQGGLTIYTTLDVDAQKAAVTAVEEGLDGYDEDFDSSLTSIDPDTGNIIAMVGGRDYSENQFNLSTQMSRQAGSSFKPFALISALELGVSPYTEIDASSPAEITPTWTVNNSEGSGYGDMTLYNATTRSVNTVYARLAHVIGAESIVETAQKMGITSELEAYESIALGTQGVCTLEMASAYATLAAGGVYRKPVAVTEVVDSRGTSVYQAEEQAGEQVISAAAAQQATEILKTVVSYGTGTAANLWCGQVAAGKTGTSENGRDLWFCGITPQLSTAVWSGYRAEKSTGLYGGSVSAPIWRAFMDAVLADAEYEEFPTTEETLEYVDTWQFPTSGYSEAEARADREAKESAEEEEKKEKEEEEKKKEQEEEKSKEDSSDSESTDPSEPETPTNPETPSDDDADNAGDTGGEAADKKQ